MKKYFLIAILFFFPLTLHAQLDSIAHAMNWTKIQPRQADIFNQDTIIYLDWDKSSVLDEVGQTLTFWVRFYNKYGSIVAQKNLVANAATLFNFTWTTYPPIKKTFILNQWGLTEVIY
jgi:hypothetical protein